MTSTKSIERKRAEAMLRITRTAFGTALGGAVPTPALEFAKEIGIAAADAWLMYDIYRIYNDEPLDFSRLQDTLGTAGMIVLTGGAVSYISLRIGQGVLNEVLNAVPFLGWSLRGIMTGATTVTVGIAWLAFVEDSYRKQNDLPVAEEPATMKRNVAQVKVPIRVPSPGSRSAFSVTDAPVDLDTDETDTDTSFTPPETSSTPEPADKLQQDDAPSETKMMTTEHPNGEPTYTIPEASYQLVRNTIIDMLRGQTSVPLQAIIDEVEAQSADELDKSARWYVTTVKMDLEARGVIKRVDGVSPQELRLIDKS